MGAISIKTFTYALLFGSIVSFISWISIVLFTDPYTSGMSTHLIFYASLFLWAMGFAVVISHLIYRKLSKGIFVQQLPASLRLGMLVGILCVSSALLQAQGMLSWWVALILLLFLSTIEMFFQTK